MTLVEARPETQPELDPNTQSDFLQGPLPRNAASDLMNQFLFARGIGEKEFDVLIDQRELVISSLNNGAQTNEALVGETLRFTRDRKTGVKTVRMSIAREEVSITVPPDSGGTILWVSHDGTNIDGHPTIVEDKLHAERKAKELVDRFLPSPKQSPLVEHIKEKLAKH